jgi:hypothetical protein
MLSQSISQSSKYYIYNGDKYAINNENEENTVMYVFLSKRLDNNHNTSWGRALYKGYFKQVQWGVSVVITAPHTVNMKWPSGFVANYAESPQPIPMKYQDKFSPYAGIYLTTKAEWKLQNYFGMVNESIKDEHYKFNCFPDESHVWTSYSKGYNLLHKEDYFGNANTLMEWDEEKGTLVPYDTDIIKY